MRTIKFRGKDIETDKWVNGDLIQRIGYTPSIMFPYESNGKVYYSENAVKRETIGQYTGLQDKNSVEIYEGDILVWSENDCKSQPLVVMFKHGSFGYIYTEDWFHPFSGNTNFTFNPRSIDMQFEIVGNIHDNPELLKGE